MGIILIFFIVLAASCLLFLLCIMISSEREQAARRKFYLEEIQRISTKYPMGTDFDYLGRKLHVIGHAQFWPMIGYAPVLKARYADDKGKIQYIEISPAELK